MPSKKTIASLVTAPITQNIALIRISGPQTYPIITKIFDRPLPENPQQKSQLIFGKIINFQQEIIDEVLLLCFYQPHSFTGEDVVEISCHGNLFIVNQILQLTLESGAVLAKEGEFTKRAFFNGKLNLIQANAINDLIRAPSLEGAKLALHNLSPETQEELEVIENELLDIIANIKVNIDYPEYDGAEYLTGKRVLPRLNKLIEKLITIKESGKKVRVYQEGLKVAIVGKPNVGKSTLLNALLQEEKAIVSPIAGTTRDIVEARYNLKGVPLILLDTAGIHETQDIVEKIGVARSYQTLTRVEIIFFLVDNSRPWDRIDENIYQKIKQKNYLLIINKIDEPNKLHFPALFSTEKVLRISAKKQQITELENKINELFASDLISNLSPYPYLSQKANYKLVKELSGKEYNEDLLDIIFNNLLKLQQWHEKNNSVNTNNPSPNPPLDRPNNPPQPLPPKPGQNPNSERSKRIKQLLAEGNEFLLKTNPKLVPVPDDFIGELLEKGYNLATAQDIPDLNAAKRIGVIKCLSVEKNKDKKIEEQKGFCEDLVVIVREDSANSNGPIVNIDGRILSDGPEVPYIREIVTSVLAQETGIKSSGFAGFQNKEVIFEVDRLASKSDKSILCRYGNTTVLTVLTVKQLTKNINSFFPLTITFEEKFYAVGRIPNAFTKRERSSDKQFCPVDGPRTPLAAVIVGQEESNLICNPSNEKLSNSPLELIVSATEKKIVMLESGAQETSNEELARAIDYRSVSRREIGHGELVEKTFDYLIPQNSIFPYTVRVVSEVFSSDGSSSQASICATSLALMTAGVPLLRPAAGIALGLFEGQIYTDINGLEDKLGEMDFKIAGTEKGICSVQLDVKNQGISPELLKECLEKSQQARLYLLGEMKKYIFHPRLTLPAQVIKCRRFYVGQEKIGLVIGPRGKTINQLTEKTGATIEVQNDGHILIYHQEEEELEATYQAIQNIVRGR
nr:15248_t:CDS:10 [Entrophospora candida]